MDNDKPKQGGQVVERRGRGGRPKGTKNRKTRLIEELSEKYRVEAQNLLEAGLPKVVRTIIDKAVNGDMQAAKLILDRCIPITKATNGTRLDSGSINIIVSTAHPDSVTIEGGVVETEAEDGSEPIAH